MPLRLQHRALYASFDRFPSAKGAGTHIARMATTMFEAMDGGLLYVLGGEDLPLYQQEGAVEIFRFAASIPNFLDRAMAFGVRLGELLDEQQSLEIVHFRDPWSGVPVVTREDRSYATIYEVNGLPSIELPYNYPHLSSGTLRKIRAAEELCWSRATRIITPSETIAENLVRLGAAAEKIDVVPNGAELPTDTPPLPPDAPASYMIYFGALQRWQGIDVLLRAFARLADLPDLHLVICASTHHRYAKIYRKLAERLGLSDRIIWQYGLGKRELASWLAHALLSVAPLVECSRNIEQGCAPLKVLESMAYGIPVIASDLPPTREIITSGDDGVLIIPDRPSELARAIRILLEYPEHRKRIGANGRAKIAGAFTWDMSMEKLFAIYSSLVVPKDDIFAGPYPNDLDSKQSIP